MVCRVTKFHINRLFSVFFHLELSGHEINARYSRLKFWNFQFDLFCYYHQNRNGQRSVQTVKATTSAYIMQDGGLFEHRFQYCETIEYFAILWLTTYLFNNNLNKYMSVLSLVIYNFVYLNIFSVFIIHNFLIYLNNTFAQFIRHCSMLCCFFAYFPTIFLMYLKQRMFNISIIINNQSPQQHFSQFDNLFF